MALDPQRLAELAQKLGIPPDIASEMHSDPEFQQVLEREMGSRGGGSGRAQSGGLADRAMAADERTGQTMRGVATRAGYQDPGMPEPILRSPYAPSQPPPTGTFQGQAQSMAPSPTDPSQRTGYALETGRAAGRVGDIVNNRPVDPETAYRKRHPVMSTIASILNPVGWERNWEGKRQATERDRQSQLSEAVLGYKMTRQAEDDAARNAPEPEMEEMDFSGLSGALGSGENTDLTAAIVKLIARAESRKNPETAKFLGELGGYKLGWDNKPRPYYTEAQIESDPALTEERETALGHAKSLAGIKEKGASRKDPYGDRMATNQADRDFYRGEGYADPKSLAITRQIEGGRYGQAWKQAQQELVAAQKMRASSGGDAASNLALDDQIAKLESKVKNLRRSLDTQIKIATGRHSGPDFSDVTTGSSVGAGIGDAFRKTAAPNVDPIVQAMTSEDWINASDEERRLFRENHGLADDWNP